MIVICPSCRTRYRHPAGPEAPGQHARCSRCESVFPVCPAASPYRLANASESLSAPGPGTRALAGHSTVPAFPTAGDHRMSVGMDDPALAEQVRFTGLDVKPGAPRQPFTYRLTADRDATAAPATTPSEDIGEHPAEALALPELEEAQPIQGLPAPRSPLRALGNALFGVACIGVGGTTGYLVSSELRVDLTVYTAAGGTAGLLVAWGWLRWMSRKP